MRVKAIFDFHSDPGHGWLKVPMSLLDILGIRDKITPYSYQKGQNAYLEEDLDAATFVNAYKARYGRDPKLRHHSTDRRSLIRAFASFGSKPFAGYGEFYKKHGFG